MTACFAGLMISCAQVSTEAQQFREHISKTYELKKPEEGVLALYNVVGSVRVEGYSGNKIIIEADKTISAKTEEEVEKGKNEFRAEFVQEGDSVVFYIAEPYRSLPGSRGNDGRREILYKARLDFVVKVPYAINLRVSTVTDGEVSVEDVRGRLNVGNVNGGVKVLKARGASDIHTVNGNIDVTYATNPPQASSYKTINGTVNVTYAGNLSAELEYKSMNGAFFTDFPDVEILPGRVIKNKEDGNGTTVYKLSKGSSIKIGSGGKIFRFETLNGNIYVKKQS